MLIFYTPSYCKLYLLSCEYGKYPECPKHPTLIQPCKYQVKREDLPNG
jgi:hypothetical protein